MFQAITTRVAHGKIKATCMAGSLTRKYDHLLTAHDNAMITASELAQRNNWAGTWEGALIEQGHYVFLCLGQGTRFIIQPGDDDDPTPG